MFVLAIVAALGLTEIDVQAREAAEARLDEAIVIYVAALEAGTDDPELRRKVSALAIALHAIYERDRMRQIDLAIDIERLRALPDHDPLELQGLEEELRQLRQARDVYLGRRTATELKQQRALTSARRRRL